MGPDRDQLANAELWALLREAALGREFAPPTDVYSTSEKVVITVELPGVPEDDVVVEHANDTLSVRGRRSFVGGPAAGIDYYRLERTYGDFSCQISLPEGSQPERRSLTWADGVLTVIIPRQ